MRVIFYYTVWMDFFLPYRFAPGWSGWLDDFSGWQVSSFQFSNATDFSTGICFSCWTPTPFFSYLLLLIVYNQLSVTDANMPIRHGWDGGKSMWNIAFWTFCPIWNLNFNFIWVTIRFFICFFLASITYRSVVCGTLYHWLVHLPWASAASEDSKWSLASLYLPSHLVSCSDAEFWRTALSEQCLGDVILLPFLCSCPVALTRIYRTYVILLLLQSCL